MNPRPGTVDYSKFEKICYESDSDEEDRRKEEACRALEEGHRRREEARARKRARHEAEQARKTQVEHDEGSKDDDEGEKLVPRRTVDLSTLQAAWSTTADPVPRTPEESVVQPSSAGSSLQSCANCRAVGATSRCSRCKLVYFCNVECQRKYHPVHLLECFDSSSHRAWWGKLAAPAGPQQPKDAADFLRNMHLRQARKRDAALKRAAVANALLRAEAARAALAAERGAKGAGGKGGKGADDDREETCAICQCEFTVGGDSGEGLKCPGFHFMCSECASVFVSSVLGDLEVSFPPKCPICRVEIPGQHFEKHLTPKQHAALRACAAERALRPGESMHKCGSCGYYEVRCDDPVVWFCKGCRAGACLVCNKALPAALVVDGVLQVDGADSLEIEGHLIACARLRVPKTIFEDAIERGGKMHCPKCNLAGRKDDACTHMSCPRCSTPWCYVCGLSVADCDKSAPSAGHAAGSDIFLHNRDWETNEARCPMYLTQILEVDPEWLGQDWRETATDADFNDDNRCLEYFHRWQTIKRLQQARAQMGAENFEMLYVHFASVRNCGFGFDEIMNTDTLTLIDRSRMASETRSVSKDCWGSHSFAASAALCAGCRSQPMPQEW